MVCSHTHHWLVGVPHFATGANKVNNMTHGEYHICFKDQFDDSCDESTGLFIDDSNMCKIHFIIDLEIVILASKQCL